MDHTTMLTDVLKLHFGWNLARIKCLSCLIIALFKVKTVNFAELATAFSGSAKPDSHYRRIQRFFKEVKIQQDMVAQLVASFLPYDQFILSMDRTNWMLGCFSINFLVLSIVHQGTAFPILWLFLPKKGNSNTKERIELIDQFLAIFGSYKIQYLTADREFIGEVWFRYLIDHKIKFRLRIKKNMNISRSNGQFSPAVNFFRSLPVSTACCLVGRRLVCGHLHCTGQKIKIADIVDKYDALAPLTHSRAASGSRAAPLACLVDLRGCFESDQIHSEKHSWLGVYVFLYESVSDH